MTAGTWRSEQDQVHCAVQDRRPAARQRDDADREGETVSRASSLLAPFPAFERALIWAEVKRSPSSSRSSAATCFDHVDGIRARRCQ